MRQEHKDEQDVMPTLEACRQVEQPCTKGIRGAMLGAGLKTGVGEEQKRRKRRDLLRADVLWCRQGSSKVGRKSSGGERIKRCFDGNLALELSPEGPVGARQADRIREQQVTGMEM